MEREIYHATIGHGHKVHLVAAGWPVPLCGTINTHNVNRHPRPRPTNAPITCVKCLAVIAENDRIHQEVD